MSSEAPPESVSAFAASLPASYREKYAADAIAEHARLAVGRGTLPAVVGSFRSASGAAICVVAADRPGLLSTISAALVICKLDVVDADAYTRRCPDGRDEAVDIFLLRRSRRDPAPIEAVDIAKVQEMLVELLRQGGDARAIAESKREPSTPRPPQASALVRFLEDSDGGLCTLEVETDDRSGLLLALSHALFSQRVQIVRSEVRTIEGRVFDRFAIVELDGAPIDRNRRLQIQVAVLNAIEPARRSTPPPA